MGSRRIIHAIDVHAAGEPGRVVLGSDLLVKGATMAERLRYCEEHLDGFRRLLLQEPRGYPGMCAPLILPPVDPDSDFGLVVMEQGGFRPMSGSNLICAVTALVETGSIAAAEPEATIRIDTAVGVVEAIATIAAGRVTEVRIHNVPAFVQELDREVELPVYGTIRADIAFGGQFYVQASAEQFGFELVPGNSQEILRAASVLRAAAAEQVAVSHPDHPEVNAIGLPMIHGPSSTPGVSGRNAVVLPNGEVDLADPATWGGTLDRSPCGTGTSARLAVLHARGELAVGEEFVHESMLGMTFRARIRGTTTVGDVPAVEPAVSGRGWITGFHQFVLEPDDPFPHGYRVGDIWNIAGVRPDPDLD